MPPRSGGTYVLVFDADRPASTSVGALGRVDVVRGFYLYVGSAHGGGGLQARVLRHLRLDKPRRWHMDYLRPLLQPRAVWWQASAQKLENHWVELMPQLGVEPCIKGFGASDSPHHTHLFFNADRPNFAQWLSLAPDCRNWTTPAQPYT